MQWDRAVQEKAAREEELERSIMAAEGEGDTAGKGAREVKQAAPKSLLGDGASKQEAAETEGVLVKATEEPALVSDGAGDSAGIKSLEAALAGQKQSSGTELGAHDVPCVAIIAGQSSCVPASGNMPKSSLLLHGKPSEG